MSKIAFVFPGQGSQYVEMGKEFAENFECASKVFDAASEALGYDMKKMCFEGPEEELKKTEITQPTILTASYAAYKVLEEKGIKPEMVAGLSLGEYSALVAAGVMNFEDAVRVVRKRGKYMQEEVPMGVGTMAAILGLGDDGVLEACKHGSQIGVCEPANFNCPKQLVIAGEVKAVESAVEKAKELGAKKAVMLPVSAPFHTSMLIGAGEKLASELEAVSIQEFDVPVVANVNADYYASKDVVKDLLIQQVSNPVRWEASVQKMIEDGVDTFVEVGPGKALSKFIKRISKEVKILNVENLESLEKTLSQLA